MVIGIGCLVLSVRSAGFELFLYADVAVIYDSRVPVVVVFER